jgi:RNA recognition motif-containing protein
MSVRLYVGNLPKEAIEREKLQAIFADEGDTVITKVIKDRKTGKCRGFAFVTVPTDELADQFIEKYNGQAFMESPIKIEKALPRSKGKNGELEDGESPEAIDTERPEKPTPKPASPRKASSSSSSSSGSGSGSGGNKKRKGSQGGSGPKVMGDGDTLQPDPRWATELAKLKEMLAAQAANP